MKAMKMLQHLTSVRLSSVLARAKPTRLAFLASVVVVMPPAPQSAVQTPLVIATKAVSLLGVIVRRETGVLIPLV